MKTTIPGDTRENVARQVSVLASAIQMLEAQARKSAVLAEVDGPDSAAANDHAALVAKIETMKAKVAKAKAELDRMDTFAAKAREQSDRKAEKERQRQALEKLDAAYAVGGSLMAACKAVGECFSSLAGLEDELFALFGDRQSVGRHMEVIGDLIAHEIALAGGPRTDKPPPRAHNGATPTIVEQIDSSLRQIRAKLGAPDRTDWLKNLPPAFTYNSEPSLMVPPGHVLTGTGREKRWVPGPPQPRAHMPIAGGRPTAAEVAFNDRMMGAMPGQRRE